MKRYDTQTDVEPGLYFNLRSLRFSSVDDPGRLPGTETDRYYRVPLLALLVAGPVLGLAFVVFLPLIGLAMFGSFLLHHLAAGISTAVSRFAHALRPEGHPTAVLPGRHTGGGTSPEDGGDDGGHTKGMAHNGRHAA